MRLRVLGVLLLLLPITLTAGVLPARAQGSGEAQLEALNAEAIALYKAGKYGDAIPLAERFAAAVKARHGENEPEYATAINNLAQLLKDTNRLAEAEPLMRRALAIDEKSYGPDHPNVAIRLNNLAQLLADTNRLAEAEPLMRRALAIDEKSYGPDHPDVARDLNNLAQLLKATNRLAEAEPLMRRALAIDEKSYGPDHPKVARDLSNLAILLEEGFSKYEESERIKRRALAIDEKAYGPNHPDVAIRLSILALLLQATNRLAEAEPLMRRALAIDEKSYGPDHPKVATRLNNLAQLLKATNRLVEAEPLMRRALAIDEKSYGPDHPNVAIRLNNLATLYYTTNRLAEAEPLMRRALAINEKSYGPDHPDVAIRLNNLAQLFKATNRLAEAEPLMRRALAIDEKSYGPDHPEVATALNNLALLLQATNRLAEAEPLMRRALAVDEKAYGPDHPDVAVELNNLTLLLQATNRLAEAEPLMRRALAINEKSYGPDHPNVARALNNLATLYYTTNRLAEAEPLYRRALAINEKSYGPDHTEVATALNNLAQLFKATNRLAEAEPLMRRVIAIFEKSYGPDHPNVARALNNLAVVREEQNDWAGGAALCLRAKPIMTGARASAETESRALTKAVLAQNSGGLRNCARAHYRADSGANLSEGFALAQWALQNAAADALNAMSLRFARGDARLALIVRAEQDLLSARTAAYRQLDAAAGKADAKAAEAARAAIAKIETQFAAEHTALRRDFPDYAALASPQPLGLAEAQALLGEDQALVVFLDMGQAGKIPGETLVFVLTTHEARWLSVQLDRNELRNRVTALRCGLDNSNWRQGQESREVCKKLLNTEASETELPPFDAQMAHTLYRDLFGGVEDLIKDKSLLIVPSGPLTQLPFEALVTRAPDSSLPRFAAYKDAAWLGQSHAITMLPSVASLKGLRTAKLSAATAPFIGFGNPLLTGEGGTDKRAWAKQTCAQAVPPQDKRTAGSAGSILSFFRGGTVDVEALRQQLPLPETADELCAVATGLDVPSAELDKTVQLGERATVTQVKAMSASGALARARVVHFATHGLLAGETAQFAKHHAEPSLLLTPPDKASDDDNGLLTASEVAGLKLDADWVIMSACNTAAGEGESAEALSGLARAFFYAGARSLLVSHWPVSSAAAVKITTGAINEMKANPKIVRAEALRRSISALIAKGKGWDHPSIWAPFVLVGNGGQ